jgi:chemotaxis protein MotA
VKAGITYSSLLGLAIALLGILAGQMLEGGKAASLVQGAALLIVLAGTSGAVLVQTPGRVFLQGLRMVRWLVRPPPAEVERVIGDVLRWSMFARKDGLLALESQVASARDPFTRRALQLLVAGVPPEKMQDAMEVEIDHYADHQRHAARIWEAAGGYAPTIGILGAVLGLIQVMENLQDPARLGSGIAVAFVATVYGVGLANLVFLPVANRLKLLIAEQVKLREMLLDGLVSMAQGEHTALIEQRLLGHVGGQRPGRARR